MKSHPETKISPASKKMGMNAYVRLGIILAVSGAATAPVFYFVAVSVPLTALSLSAIIVGLVSALLGNTRPDISPEASRMMMETGMENIASLFEELGLETRAIYLPSTGVDPRPKALIPLKDDGKLPDIGAVPKRLIARYGPNLENMCLIVTTPGSMSLDGIALVRGGGLDQLESALNQILVGKVDMTNSVILHAGADSLMVDLIKPKLQYENTWYSRCLGSPLASIAAAAAAEAFAKPVRIKSETRTDKHTVRIELEVLP